MNKNMIDILACPMDKHFPLEIHECSSDNNTVETGALYCEKCSRFYPILDGIPIMLPDDLRDKELDKKFLQKNSKLLPEKIIKAKPYCDNM